MEVVGVGDDLRGVDLQPRLWVGCRKTVTNPRKTGFLLNAAPSQVQDMHDGGFPRCRMIKVLMKSRAPVCGSIGFLPGLTGSLVALGGLVRFR